MNEKLVVIIFLFYLVTAPLCAASTANYDAQLADQLRIVQSSDMYSNSEKIGTASKRVQELLLKWADQPALMSDPLRKSKSAGLDIIESGDHALRIYNWNTRTGGTMQVYANVKQYRVGGKFAAARGKDDDSEEVIFSKIEPVRTTGGEVVYLLFTEMIGSSVDFSTGVRAVAIKGGRLQEVKFFKTRTALLSNIECDTNRNTIDAADNYVGIEFVKASRTIKVPLINKDMTFDNRYLLYKFDGQKFVYKGVSDEVARTN